MTQPADRAEQLHAAARAGNADAVKQLISQGADPNAAGASGDTPLHVCAESASCEAARELLLAGANPSVANENLETPLMLCASSEDCLPLLQLLLQHGASCEQTDADSDNCLHRACFAENTEAVRLLLEAAPALANSQNSAGCSALHIAAAQENCEMLMLLLSRGADFSLPDAHSMSPVDILLANEDTSGIHSLGRFLYRGLSQFVEGEEAVEVISSQTGCWYLQKLMAIDAVWEAPATAEDAARSQRMRQLQHIISLRKVDAAVLTSELVAAFKEGLLDQLGASGLLQRCAQKICDLVLMPQDEKLLQLLVAERKLWAALSFSIELQIEQLYARMLRKKKAGVREMLRRSCTDSSGQAICWRRLAAFVAELTACWQFDSEHRHFANSASGWTQWHKRPQQDPLQSLVVWAIFSSRLKLVPILLRQEQFDLVPLALVACTILRALGRKRNIEDVFAEKATKIANVCEGMALQVLKAVKDVDSSPNNSLTIDYILLPLASFGNYTVLDLAARGSASKFIKMDIVEQAVEKSWYGDFFESRSAIGREVTILSGFVPPLMLLLPRLMRHLRRSGSSCFMEAVVAAGSVGECKDNHQHQQQLQQEQQEQQQQQGAVLHEEARQQLTEQQLDLQRKRQQWSSRVQEYLSAMLLFYSTPCVKFRLHAFFYFLLVSALSYLILHDFEGSFSLTESFCYLCLLGVFIQEVREMLACAQRETLSDYLMDGWNSIDLVAFACGFVAFVLRVLDHEHLEILESFTIHRDRLSSISYVLIVTTTLIFWIRLLFIAVVLESVGVKLKMLSLMIKKDFIPFLYILFVIMIGFGIAFHALLWPNAKYFANGKYIDIPPVDIFFEMFRRTFYTIVGEYGLDDLSNECEMTNSTTAEAGAAGEEKCVNHPGNMLVTFVLMVIYIVIVQVLLLNVIVAMFSKTIDMVDSESKSMWLFERYDLTQEFKKRPALPPPLNVALELQNLAARLSGGVRRSVLNIVTKNVHNFVYMFYLFYQSVAMRRARRRLDGLDIDEDDLISETLQLVRMLAEQQDTNDRIAAAISASRRSSLY